MCEREREKFFKFNFYVFYCCPQVQAATAAFIEKFNRPQPLQTSSIDFSQPRLVQINVSDVGACMPVLFMVRKPLHKSM